MSVPHPPNLQAILQRKPEAAVVSDDALFQFERRLRTNGGQLRALDPQDMSILEVLAGLTRHFQGGQIHDQASCAECQAAVKTLKAMPQDKLRAASFAITGRIADLKTAISPASATPKAAGRNDEADGVPEPPDMATAIREKKSAQRKGKK
jgi:hypothetical protein